MGRRPAASLSQPRLHGQGKGTAGYRNYASTQKDSVREFYRLNHQYQTVDFVQQKRAGYLHFNKKEMPVWEAFDFLNELVDDSDPDTDLTQFQHLLQTSQAIRADGHRDWNSTPTLTTRTASATGNG